MYFYLLFLGDVFLIGLSNYLSFTEQKIPFHYSEETKKLSKHRE